MCRHAAVIVVLGVILGSIAFVPRAHAQESDTLWTDTFSNQAEHDWTVQAGNWRVFFTEYRGQTITRRAQFIYEANVVTHGAAGPTPIVDWRSAVRLRGHAGSLGHKPQILAVRHNVTAQKEGFGVEISFNSTGPDLIRIVRYGPNYGSISPALASADTTLDEDEWYAVKFSVVHTPLGVELKAKVWPSPTGLEPEPDAWLLETISQTVVSGPDFSIGALATYSDPSVSVDYVVILGDKTPVESTSWGRIKRTFR